MWYFTSQNPAILPGVCRFFRPTIIIQVICLLSDSFNKHCYADCVNQSAPTLDRARCGKVSITRLVSSPEFPANWPFRIRVAVTVVIPIPGNRWKHTWVLDNINQTGTGLPLCSVNLIRLSWWWEFKGRWKASELFKTTNAGQNVKKIHVLDFSCV